MNISISLNKEEETPRVKLFQTSDLGTPNNDKRMPYTDNDEMSDGASEESDKSRAEISLYSDILEKAESLSSDSMHMS